MVTLPAEGRVFTHRDRVMLGRRLPQRAGAARRARPLAAGRRLRRRARLRHRRQEGAWIVRRLALRVRALPAAARPDRGGDTFCSGTAALWAERSQPRPQRRRAGRATPSRSGCTSSPTARARGRCPPASTPSTGRRRCGRRVRARLHHPAAPPADAPAPPWRFRGADLDLAGHVNNAVYWAALEEELVADEPAGGLAAEIEHRAAGGNRRGGRPPRTARCAGSPTRRARAPLAAR